MSIPIHLLLTIGIPSLISLVCLVLSYVLPANSLPLPILGWGSLLITIIVTYMEWYSTRLRSAFRRDTSYDVAQRKSMPVLHQIEGLVQSAKKGEEIFATATFPLSKDYEKKLIDKVLALAKLSTDKSEAVFTRVISNVGEPAIKTWVAQMKDSSNQLYGKLHPFMACGQVRIYLTDHPVGMDILMVAGPTRKTVLLGIKEEPADVYLNPTQGQLISRGNTFIFESDSFADSIYSYYAKFICAYLEKQGCRLKLQANGAQHE